MKVFFITGVQRSGTTMLSVMLSKHPAIHLDGNALAFRLVSCFNNYELVLPHNLEYASEDIFKWLISNDYKGRLAEFLDVARLENFPDIRSLIKASIQNQLNKNSKTVFGDKSPNIQHSIPELLRLMPEAKFIHIIRDGRATALSLSKRAYKNLYLSAQEWVDGNINGLFNKELIGPEQFHVLHYEDLIRQPEKTIQTICAFLDLPYDPATLNLEVDLAEGETPYVKKNFDIKKIAAYKNELSERQIAKIEKIQGPLLQKLGYNLFASHKTTTYKYLSVRKRIWLNQKDNFKSLFRRKKIGMHNRKEIITHLSFKKRVYYFLLRLCYDLLPLPVFKSLFRRSYVKEKYMDKKSD